MALWQTDWVIKILKSAHPKLSIEIKKIKTKGDKLLDVALAKIGDKGLFTKELELAMLRGEIDLAVHSMKDLPSLLPSGLTLGAVLERGEPGDVVISHKEYNLSSLPQGAKVGTSSLRRRAQLLAYRPDLMPVDLRGNVGTRIEKMRQEKMDAIILAAAGVERLGYQDVITERISYDLFLPSVGQGAIGIEAREGDEGILTLLQEIAHQKTEQAVLAERAFLRRLEGGCQIPIGALGQVQGEEITLKGMVASLDGTRIIKGEIKGGRLEAEALGIALGEQLLQDGAEEILKELERGAKGDD